MDSSSKSFLKNNDAKLYSPNKVTSLNPNAAEFVPYSLRSPSGNKKTLDGARLHFPGTSGKSVSDRSEINLSNSSDDEAHRYWWHQLPDDITPDFKVMGEEGLQLPPVLSLSRLSLSNGIETSRFPMAVGSQILGKKQISSQGSEDVHLSGRTGYSGLATAVKSLGTNQLEKQFMNDNQHVCNGRERDHFGGNSNATFPSNLLNESCGLDNGTVNSVKFLAPQFPDFADFAVERPAKRQADNGFDQNMNSKTLSAPTLSALQFPAHLLTDSQNGLSKYASEHLPRGLNTLQSVNQGGFSILKSPMPDASRDMPDFASSVHRLPSQDFGCQKYEIDVSMDVTGSNRNSQLLASSHNGYGKQVYADNLQDLATIQAAQVWLETGDAVAHTYSEKREEEAHDFACLRNACFEPATQTHKIRNEALAKELCIKGPFHDIQMKQAHEKDRELMYQQRNPVTFELRSYNRGYDPLIDLHGLNLNEAIHLLKYEINILRRTAKSAGKRLQVMIYVGTGHHTKGAHTLARLPVAVQQYLLDENLQFSEDQPGLLRVVI